MCTGEGSEHVGDAGSAKFTSQCFCALKCCLFLENNFDDDKSCCSRSFITLPSHTHNGKKLIVTHVNVPVSAVVQKNSLSSAVVNVEERKFLNFLGFSLSFSSKTAQKI